MKPQATFVLMLLAGVAACSRSASVTQNIVTYAYGGNRSRFLTPEGTELGKVTKKWAGLGKELFTRWAIPFEVASLVLLVALIGAIVIARPGGQE